MTNRENVDVAISNIKEEGNRAFKVGDFSAAIKCYEVALRHILLAPATKASEPPNTTIEEALHTNLAQCYLMLKNWTGSIESSSRALKLNSHNEKALYRRALGYEQIGRFNESLTDVATLVKQGNKDGLGIISRLQKKLAAEKHQLIDDSLPDQLLATVTRAMDQIQIQLRSPTPASRLLADAAKEVTHGMDTLRTWVIRYDRRRMVMKHGTVPTLINFLKWRADAVGIDRTAADGVRLEVSEKELLTPEVVPPQQMETESVADSLVISIGENSRVGTPHSLAQHPVGVTPSTMDTATVPPQPDPLLESRLPLRGEDTNGCPRIHPQTAAETFGKETLWPSAGVCLGQLVTTHALLTVQVAIWRLLITLLANTKFSEDEQQRQQRVERQVHLLGKPVELDSLVLQARTLFASHLSADEMFEFFRAYVRSGLGPLDEANDTVQCDIRSSALRSRCAILILEGLRSIGTLEGGGCLETIALGISASECPPVVTAALQTLGGLADSRRRFGSEVKALKKSQALMKALENTLPLLSCECETLSVVEAAEFALTSVFTLLADKDRSPDDEIDIQELALLLLGPYFIEGRDAMDSFIGLRALLLLWMADRESVKSVLSTNHLISLVTHLTCHQTACCPQLQGVAADVLMHAMEFSDLRQQLLDVQGITELTDLCACQLRSDKDTVLKIKVAAILARVCMHSEDIRKQVFKEFDFFQMAADCLGELHIRRNPTAASRAMTQAWKQTIKSFLEVLFFLTLHGAFKAELLRRMERTSSPTGISPLASSISYIGECLVQEKDTLGGYYFSNVFCNLLRSREDREKKRRRPTAAGPQLDEEQLEALEEFYQQLPEYSRPEKQQFDRGASETVASLKEILIQQKIVKHLSQLCLLKNSTLNELSAASEAIGLFARETKHRGIILQQGGVSALLVSAKALEIGGAEYQQDLSMCRQALAHLCISINTNLFTYREVLDTVPHLLALLNESYELYQYEACLALTNITSVSEEARNRVFHGHGWRAFLDVATGDNALCRAAGLEGLCNMAMCELVQERFAGENATNPVDLQILLAFLGEKDNGRGQSAASGCLAILSSDLRVALRLCLVSNVSNLVTTIREEEEMAKKPEVLLRVATVASNIAQAVQLQEPLLVKPPTANGGEPVTMTVTDEMRSVSRNICEAFKTVDRSNYSAAVLELLKPLLADRAL